MSTTNIPDPPFPAFAPGRRSGTGGEDTGPEALLQVAAARPTAPTAPARTARARWSNGDPSGTRAAVAAVARALPRAAGAAVRQSATR